MVLSLIAATAIASWIGNEPVLANDGETSPNNRGHNASTAGPNRRDKANALITSPFSGAKIEGENIVVTGHVPKGTCSIAVQNVAVGFIQKDDKYFSEPILVRDGRNEVVVQAYSCSGEEIRSQTVTFEGKKTSNRSYEVTPLSGPAGTVVQVHMVPPDDVKQLFIDRNGDGQFDERSESPSKHLTFPEEGRFPIWVVGENSRGIWFGSRRPSARYPINVVRIGRKVNHRLITQLEKGQDLTLGQDVHLYVLTSNPPVLHKYDGDLRKVTEIPITGFPSINAFDVTYKGLIIALDSSEQSRLLRFTAAGSLDESFGTRGISGATYGSSRHLINPLDVALVQEEIFVADTGNRRVVKFNANGYYRGEVLLPATPTCLSAFDIVRVGLDDGKIIAINPETLQIVGEFRTSLKRIDAIDALPALGIIAIADNQIHFFSWSDELLGDAISLNEQFRPIGVSLLSGWGLDSFVASTPQGLQFVNVRDADVAEPSGAWRAFLDALRAQNRSFAVKLLSPRGERKFTQRYGPLPDTALPKVADTLDWALIEERRSSDNAVYCAKAKSIAGCAAMVSFVLGVDSGSRWLISGF